MAEAGIKTPHPVWQLRLEWCGDVYPSLVVLCDGLFDVLPSCLGMFPDFDFTVDFPPFSSCFRRAALYFGVVLFIDVWMLLLPIPQSSFLQDLSGLDYHQMIRYHRQGRWG